MSETAPKPPSTGPAPSRRLQYTVLGREGLEFKLGPRKVRGELVEKDEVDERFTPAKIPSPVRDFEYSQVDGRFVSVLMPSGFKVLDTDSGDLVCEIDRPNVHKVALSPLGTFALSWEKYTPGMTEGNMIVWRLSDKKIMFQVVEKNMLSWTWPAVKWTNDEMVAAHMIKNSIHIYDGKEFGRYIKLRDEGVTQFSIMKTAGELTEETPCRIATFKPEIKGSPAKVSIFNHPGNLERPVAGKTFFKAQEAKFEWSSLGNAVLCKTDTDVDTTGQSYYGESALYLVHADGQYDCKILPAKEGSFHDFAWSPQGRNFVAISGKSPASSIMYNIKGDPVFDFGQAHRNTIRWSPHGRFLCLGGFGNLSGDMDFWDINKRAKMGSTRAHCAVTQQWSPCGRFFMTSTLFPRMRVDNGMTFYTYKGEKLYSVMVRECSKALWRPAATGVFADRPQTPLKKGEKAAKASPKAADAPKKVGVYRPPGMQGTLAAQMRKEREGSAAPRKLTGSSATGPQKPQKSKAALRRERKKKAAAAKAEEGN